MLTEILEDFALAKAIEAGETTPSASREEIFNILQKVKAVIEEVEAAKTLAKYFP